MPSLPFITAIRNVSADVITADLQDLSVYGGAGPARSDLALYAYLFKRDASNNDVAVPLSNTIPLTVTSWQFELNGDGLYVALIYGFPIWTAGAYLINDCVYSGGVFYRANTGTSGVPGSSADWTVITNVQSEVVSSGNTYLTQTDNFTTALLEAGKIGETLQNLGQKIIQGQIRNSDDVATAMFAGGLIQSAWVNFRRGDSQDAQEIVEWLTGQYLV